MNITEKSKEYAKGKAFEAMTAAIEQAYADGYNDGMQHRENLILESIVDGVEYVDLDLDSRLLWSSRYVKKNDMVSFLPYIEASKLHIPTKENFDELFRLCAIDCSNVNKSEGIRFTGKNGKTLIIPYFHPEEIKYDVGLHFHFWLKDEGDHTNKKYAYNLLEDGNIVGKVGELFMGYKLPVMLVKEKSEI